MKFSYSTHTFPNVIKSNDFDINSGSEVIISTSNDDTQGYLSTLKTAGTDIFLTLYTILSTLKFQQTANNTLHSLCYLVNECAPIRIIVYLKLTNISNLEKSNRFRNVIPKM